ncbi:MAG: S1-like domain-containing RNA-binding protein [Flavobacteriales bacterium]|nr:S1-like domain-containing RNA-binding protein [Flavobacteriales bacterium]MDP4954151.1 S1-like domain-containing RNA-binding protein [Flavobacteriales bacterium]
MTQPGRIQELPILRIERNDAWLGEEENEVHLSLAELPVKAKEGDLIEVFVHFDAEKNLIATTKFPEVSVGKLAFLRVNHINKELAYVDLGFEKDYIIPPKHQPDRIIEGKKYHMTMLYDPKDKELVLSADMNAYLRKSARDLKEGDQVEIDVWKQLDNGAKCIIQERFWAFLPKMEQVFLVKRGDHLKAWVKEVKGRDVYLSLQEQGEERMENACKKLLDMLEMHNGYVRLNDKTTPEEIQLRLRMSKKTFKKAVGMLLKEGKIAQTPRAIKLIKTDKSTTPS